MHILVNDFAIRSFRETADKDYITARMAYRARLIQPFLWSALHCLEKYVKGVLVLNRMNAKDLGHTVLPGIERMKQSGKFEIELSANTVQFINGLEDYGAKYRYYEVSYDIEPFDIVRHCSTRPRSLGAQKVLPAAGLRHRRHERQDGEFADP